MPTATLTKKAKHHPVLLATIIIAIIAAILFGVVLLIGTFAKKTTVGFPFTMNKSKYYAVFLDNGQVYFGGLRNYYASKNPILYDIYYLQTGQELQSGEKKEGEQKESQFNLVKLGQELHGPKDAMILNKEHILFIEELKDDGQVVKAILEHQKSESEKK